MNDIKWFKEINSYQFYSKKIKNNNNLQFQNFSFLFREEIITSKNNLMSKVMYTWSESFLNFIKDKGFKYTHSRQINKIEFFEWVRVATNLQSLSTDFKDKLWNGAINSNLFAVYGDRNRKNINELILQPVTKIFDEETLLNSLVVRYVPKIKEKTSFVDMQTLFIEFLYGSPTIMNNKFIQVSSQSSIGDMLELSQQEIGRRMKNRQKVYQFKIATDEEKSSIIAGESEGRLIKVDNLGYNLNSLSKLGVIESNGNVWVKMVGTKLLTNFKYKYRKIGKNNKFKFVPIKGLKEDLNLTDINFKTFSKNEILSKDLKCVRFINKDNLPSVDSNKELSESQYISLVSKSLLVAMKKLKSMIRVQYFVNELNTFLITPLTKYISSNLFMSRLGYYSKKVADKLKGTDNAHVVSYIFKNLDIIKKYIQDDINSVLEWKTNRKPIRRKMKLSIRRLYNKAKRKFLSTMKKTSFKLEMPSELSIRINNFNKSYELQKVVV